jgi:hypothetical protein
MPAVYLLADGRRRIAAVKQLGIFDEDIYLHEVYVPILAALGLDYRELRGPRTDRKSAPVQKV